MSDSYKRNTYQIDRNDRIVAVGSEWDSFATENEAPELAGRMVIERSIWDYLSDDLTRHVYQQMLVEVRKGTSLAFTFRCDSPDRRRFLEMRLTPLSKDGVQFETLTNRIEERSSQELYRRTNKFNDLLIITCSWCKRIKTAESVWHEVEQAVHILELFDLSPAPQISHGMCGDCYKRITATINSEN